MTPDPVAAPPAPAPVAVVDTAGKVSLVAPDVASQLGDGFSLATPEQASIAQERESQKGILGALKAASQGAIDTATFGTASAAEVATGLRTPEAIAAGEQQHPVSTFLGSAAGAAIPGAAEELLTAKGLGGAARLAGAAPGAISDLGEGAASAVRASAAPTTKLGRIGLEVLSHGAGSAVEGAAYGLGQSVHEDALDPDLTVESAMARGGTDALLGAGLGAAVGAPIGLVSSALGRGPHGSELADNIQSWLEDFEGERRLNLPGGSSRKLIKQVGRDEAIRLGNESYELGIQGRYSTPESVNQKATALMDSTGQEQRALIGEVDAAAAGKPRLQANAERVLQEFRDGPLRDLQADPFQKAAAATLQGYADELQAKIDAAGTDGRLQLQELWDLRKSADRAIKWDATPGPSAVKDALRDLRGSISREMDATIERSGQDTSEWKRLNRTYRVASVMEKLSAAGIEKHISNNPLSLTEGLAVGAGLLHGGPLGALLPAAYIAAHRLGPNAAALAARTAREALGGAGKAAPLVAGLEKSTAKAAQVEPVPVAPQASPPAPIYGAFGMGFRPQTAQAFGQTFQTAARVPREQIAALAALEKTSRDVVQDSRAAMSDLVTKGRVPKPDKAPRSADILQTVRSVNRLTNDPAHTARVVSRLTAETNDHAPTMTVKTGEVSGRAISYLQQNAPQVAKPFPLGPVLMPDRGALLSFHEKAEALRDPVAALTHSPTPTTVQAIEAVYPALLSNFRASLIAALAEAGPEKVYTQKQRAAFSAIMGDDLDGSNSPRMMALSQAVFLASANATGQHARTAARKSLKTKSLAERYSPTGSASLRNP